MASITEKEGNVLRGWTKPSRLIKKPMPWHLSISSVSAEFDPVAVIVIPELLVKDLSILLGRSHLVGVRILRPAGRKF